MIKSIKLRLETPEFDIESIYFDLMQWGCVDFTLDKVLHSPINWLMNFYDKARKKYQTYANMTALSTAQLTYHMLEIASGMGGSKLPKQVKVTSFLPYPQAFDEVGGSPDKQLTKHQKDIIMKLRSEKKLTPIQTNILMQLIIV